MSFFKDQGVELRVISGDDPYTVSGIAAAVIGMIPQGLVMLTCSVLAIATTCLAMRKVLVQQAYCVETLARVDVLCLDKTGTITTGSMELGDTLGEGALEAAYAVARANEADANETARAILAAGADAGLATPAIERSVPFSSKTKYSGCVLVGGRCLVMGAAQFVLGDDFAAHEAEVRSFDQLQRVLVVAEADSFADDGTLEGRPRVIGFVGIRDEIRRPDHELLQGPGRRVARHLRRRPLHGERHRRGRRAS